MNIADNQAVSYIGKCHQPSPILSSITDSISHIEPNTPLDLKLLLLDDHRRCYKRTQTLQQGIQVPIVRIQYSAGGYLHWISQCIVANTDDALRICHPTIENLKKNILQFYTRAMRKDAFELSGLVLPNTKKSAVIRLYK